jgi:pimeloyl-ACP methyl ester carboxylesterase
MLQKRNSIVYGSIVLVCICIFWFVIFADRHELESDQQIELGFISQWNNLSGTLLLPPGQWPFPVVIFIHGDGAQTRGIENYSLVMNTFLRSGIACYTWDKAGIGQSEGNWLNQTMTDRALEGLVAMEMLSKRSDIKSNAIGFIGFSQWGWVISEMARLGARPAFFITVGAALDWREQSTYFTRMRLSRSGMTGSLVDQVIAWQNRTPQPTITLNYMDYIAQFRSYLSTTQAPDGADTTILSPERYHFVALNIDANSRIGLASVKSPFLAIWGADDWNVDASRNAHDYTEILSTKKDIPSIVQIFPWATHTLLRSSSYGSQLPSEWTMSMSVHYFFEAESALAPGYLRLLSDWTREQIQ